MQGITLDSIVRAKHNLNDIIKNTPFQLNERLSEKYNATVFLKREDLQTVRSYKIRGAFNFICNLSAAQRSKGLVCASAGNHAQGLAFACNYFNLQGTIFMPATTPRQKIDKTLKFGKENIEVKLVGDTFDDAHYEAVTFCEEMEKIFVHPFDDPLIISGQGTVGFEILSDSKQHIDFILVPVGGGGLLAGLGTYFQSMSPKTKIIGVEPQGAPTMLTAFNNKKVTSLKEIDPFVDGAAVKRAGDLNYAIASKITDEIRLIPEGRLCTSMLSLLYEDGIVTEPAGALTIDALADIRERIQGKTVVCVVSGGNFDFERLPIVKEKSLIYEGLKHYFLIQFAQRPGALREFLDVLGPKDDITRFEYIKKTNKEMGPALVGIELQKKEDYNDLIERMVKNRTNYTEITHNKTLFDLMV